MARGRNMKIQHVTRLGRGSLLLGISAALILLVYGAGSSAGIQGSGRISVLAFGRITAFGSIFVNGVEYAISSAQIDMDGRSVGQSRLQVGQIVAVQASVGPAGTTGTATSVSFTGNVVGPVAQLNLAGGSFRVLGQTVRLDDMTVFGDGIQPAGIGGLQQGVMVEVSGFADASGSLVASRIDLAAGVPLQVKGTVQTLDTNAQTFRINDLTIDYSGVAPTGKLVNGSTATVQSEEFAASGTLHATRVHVSFGLGGAANEQGQLEGLITSFKSDNEFYVGDQLVLTSATTRLVLHGQALGPDLPVKVSGIFAASGALMASEIKGKPQTSKRTARSAARMAIPWESRCRRISRGERFASTNEKKAA
jgi:hypothetical protein